MATLSNGRGWLADDAAASIHRMDKAYGGLIPINSAGRTWAEQNDLYRDYLYNGGALALPPGTSIHESGRACDFTNTVWGWLGSGKGLGWNGARANGFGWRRTVPSEAWHFEYDRDRDIAFAQEYLGLDIDGDQGPKTTEGIKQFQRDNGLDPDGIFGPATRSKMEAKAPAKADKAVKDRQSWLNKILGINLTVDGIDGPETTNAIRTYQGILGAEPDGIWGDNTQRLHALMYAAVTNAEKDLPVVVDSLYGWGTIAKLQKRLGVKIDAQEGPTTVKALQTALGAKPDGEWGTETTTLLQAAIGANPDGDFGPDTVKKLQLFLNSGKPFTKQEKPPVVVKPPVESATPRPATYPSAIRAWLVPLRSARTKGSVIDTLVVHHQGNTNDDEEFFKTANARTSCPTWQVKANGKVVEFIDPGQRPSSTADWNDRSVAIETQNTSMAPNWGISEESKKAIAEIAVWLSKQTEINGVPVKFTIDRAHVVGHNETGAATACPGPSMDLDGIVRLANEMAKPTPAPEPEPEPDTVQVERKWLQSILDKVKALLGK